MMSQILQTIFDFLLKANPPETQLQKNNDPQSSRSTFAAKEFPAAGSSNNKGTVNMQGAINNSGHVEGSRNGSIISSSKSGEQEEIANPNSTAKEEEEEIIKFKSMVKDCPSGIGNSGTLNLVGAINNLGWTHGNGNGSIIISADESIKPKKKDMPTRSVTKKSTPNPPQPGRR